MAVDRDYLQAQIAALRMLADAAERAGDTAGAATYLRLRAHQMDRLRDLEERLAVRPKTAHDVGTMEVGTDSRGLKIAKTKSSGRKRHKAVQALYDAGLTPATAAAICGTSRDILKQAWSKDPQFREIRPEWEKRLEAAGVPRSVWPRKG